MNGFKEFWNNYKGAIIGVVIAALILITRLQDLIIAIVVLVLGALIGNYIYLYCFEQVFHGDNLLYVA